MTENLTILKKGLVLLAIPFLFQFIFIGILAKSNLDAATAQGWALHSKAVIAKVEELYRHLVEAHSNLRGLVLTANPEFDAPIAETRRTTPEHLAELADLVVDNPRQSARVREIRAQAATLLAWQLETANAVKAGRRAEANERVASLVGRDSLDAVRGSLDQFLREEERLDAERTRRLDASSRRQFAILVIGGLLALLGVAALSTVFSRAITRRLAVLTANADRLAEGKELERPLTGRDELAQLDRVFHAMARSLAEKNREIELFIYSVSHDLRSPLVNLQGFSQELRHAAGDLRTIVEGEALPAPVRRRAIGLIDDEIGSSIHFIQTAVARLSVIIDALLRLSRAGRVEYRWQSVDVDATIGRVVEALHSSVSERGATVTRQPVPDAWGDPTAVEQIFANLIGNAVNYLDPKRPGEIEVGAVAAPSAPRVGPAIHTYYVKDNGLGIPDSGKAKMFLAFQRFHDRSARGEGIGLALVRRIVERHGGRIRVESQAGVGSTFFVDLPGGPPEDGLEPGGRAAARGA